MSLVTLSNAKSFTCGSEATLLDAARNQDLVLEHSCRTGRCGVCKAKVISGETHVIKAEDALTSDEISAGFILTCARSALSDVTLDVEDLGRLAAIKTQTLPCRIDSIQLLASDVIQVFLRLPPKNTFEYLSGQYIDVIAKNGIRRSYSVASSHSSSDKIELHIRQVPDGEMSQYWFKEAKNNDLLRFEGPHGTFCFREKPFKNIIFLATGTGIAPVKSMLEDMNTAAHSSHTKNISIYWGGRIPEDMYWQPQLDNLSVSFIPVLSRADGEWKGRRGYIQDAVIADGIDLSDAVVYACGSDAMIHSARELLLASGLAQNNFYSDAFVSSK
jgi:CDP-4-dehydro-6-deoxyglucose reductase